MKSSIVILLVVIAVSMGCASNASAQCASLYTSDGPDGSGNVHAWTILTDNYTNSSSGCAPQNWPPNGFTHTYNLSISVTSPSGRKATGTGYGNQQGGQGTATTRADVYLAIDGEGGSFNLSGQDTIYCTVAGLFFFAGISGSFSPPPPVINGVSDNSTGSTTIYQGTSGYLAIYGTALTAWGETPSPTVTGDSGVTLSTYWASDTQVDASYTVSAQAATGQHSLALQTAAGRAQGTYTVAAPPRLSCVPSSITRGSSVTCTVTNATVTQWSFSASGVAVTGPANGSTWSGPVVISGTVTAAISSGGPLTAAITVNARPNFPAVTMPAPQLVGNGAYLPNGTQLPTLTSPPDTSPGSMGAAAYGWNYKLDAPPITGGPNLGLYYVRSFSDASSYGWELNPALTNPLDPFYQAQSGVCWAGVPAIITAVQNHETGQPSHYSEAAASLAGYNPATQLEDLIGGSLDYIEAFIVKPYQAAAAAAGPEPPGAYQLPANINYPPYGSCQ